MTALIAQRDIARPFDQAAAVFDRPIRTWLPVVAGPDEDSWRILSQEGPIHLRVVIRVGPVWDLPDNTHRRHLDIEPDRTAFRDLFTSILTPRSTGHLSLHPADDGTTTQLRYEGHTQRGSRITGALERLLIGDLLARSGIHTLLDRITDALGAANRPSPAPGFESKGQEES